MYIFEAIIKYLKGKSYQKRVFNPLEDKDDIIERPEDCEHLFLPLDESKEYFACKYCGLVVHKNNLK